MITSPYLIAIGLAWLLSHIVKYLIAYSKGKQVDLTHQLFISGGMPSSHAATTTALWMVVALRDGTDGGLFGLATLVVLIACYDSVKVRRSSGEQGEAITSLIHETKSNIRLPRAAKGHTPAEVFAGACFGSLIGVVVVLAT